MLALQAGSSIVLCSHCGCHSGIMLPIHVCNGARRGFALLSQIRTSFLHLGLQAADLLFQVALHTRDLHYSPLWMTSPERMWSVQAQRFCIIPNKLILNVADMPSCPKNPCAPAEATACQYGQNGFGSIAVLDGPHRALLGR